LELNFDISPEEEVKVVRVQRAIKTLCASRFKGMGTLEEDATTFIMALHQQLWGTGIEQGEVKFLAHNLGDEDHYRNSHVFALLIEISALQGLKVFNDAKNGICYKANFFPERICRYVGSFDRSTTRYLSVLN
jgi:hypothetical protein